MKQETGEERKFQKGVKERHDSDMKQFLAQQKADYKGTKAMYKRVRPVVNTLFNCDGECACVTRWWKNGYLVPKPDGRHTEGVAQ